MSTAPKTLGKLPPSAFGTLELPRLPREIVAGFAALVDLTGTVSDAMDNLGYAAALPASSLRPSLPGKRVFVPRAHAAAILEEARKIDAGDTKRKQDIDAGVDIGALMTKKYK